MVVIKFSVLLRKYKHDIIKSTILYPDPTGKKGADIEKLKSR